VQLSARIPVFLQRVLRREELVQTHLEGLACLVSAEDWILGCLHDACAKYAYSSIGPLPPARHDVMRKECGATGKRAAPGEGWRAGLCELWGTSCTSARKAVLSDGLGLAKSANFGTDFRAKGTVGNQRIRKLLRKNKNGSGAATEFCGYRKVIDADPTDLRL
jgi:hypothetical protein